MENKEKTIKAAKQVQQEKSVSSAEARQILEKETQEKIRNCWEEVAKSLEKYNLQFDVITILRGNSISHQINLVPAPIK